MQKLTAEKCREQIDDCIALKERGYLSINGEYKLQALEIALPILEQQERGEGGWVDWVGGQCPVGYDELVEIRCRGGAKFNPNRACQFAWDHAGVSLDIIAYRIIPERATNQNGEQ